MATTVLWKVVNRMDHVIDYVIDENKEESSQQIRSKFPIIGTYTTLNYIIVHHHDKHLHESDKATRSQCTLLTLPIPMRHT